MEFMAPVDLRRGVVKESLEQMVVEHRKRMTVAEPIKPAGPSKFT